MSIIRMPCWKLPARKSYIPGLSECEPRTSRTDGFVGRFVALSSVSKKASSAPTCWRDLRRVETWKIPRTRRVPEGSAKPRQQKRVAKGRPTHAQRLGAHIRWSLSGRCPACFAALVVALFCFYSGSWRASVKCFDDWLKGRALAARRTIVAMWTVSGSSKVWLQRLMVRIAGKSGKLESLWGCMIDSGADQVAVAVAVA